MKTMPLRLSIRVRQELKNRELPLIDNKRLAMPPFTDKQEGALHFLSEVLTVLEAKEVPYCIIGGWVPFLCCRGKIKHPGTFDVDVLLPKSFSVQELEDLYSSYLAEQFIEPAKNYFQLFRELPIKDSRLIYHIDFIHPEAAEAKGLIINDFEFVEGKHKRSIGTPGLNVIFEHQLTQRVDLAAYLPINGKHLVGTFTSLPGIIASKGDSITKAKRLRDAFDIYLIISQAPDYKQLVGQCRMLAKSDEFFKDAAMKIKNFFKSGQGGQNTYRVIAATQREAIHPGLEDQINTDIGSFFKAIGLS